MQVRDKLYINGQWRAPSGKSKIDVICSSTEEVIGCVPEGTVADADAAVQAARDAFEGWAATPVAERAAILGKIQQGLMSRMQDIAQLIAQEVGMPYKLAMMIQAGLPIASFGYAASALPGWQLEKRIGNSLVVLEPAGVVVAITPWNYPLHQIAGKVAPALAAGCTVVLKPSSQAPLNAFLLAEVIEAAGVPKGVFNLVTGRGVQVGERLASHPDVDMISLTGSTRSGRRIAELASHTIKRVALELGGKSASVILDDADLSVAVRGTMNACMLNSGQTCSAHTRMVAPESRYAEIAKRAVEEAEKFTLGDPFDEATRLGPLVSARQRETVRNYIRKGMAEGAELLCGGPDAPANLPKGWYVKPTVFGRVDPNSTIAQEEIFGPVLSIIPYKTEDDAVRIANNSIYGLAGGVWAGSDERAMRVARRIRTGQVDINGGAFNVQAPFGGYKQSGYGRELGPYGLEEFFEVKALQLNG